jgi:hypothetical protein
VVEGAALEMLYRGNSIEGSNPSLSVDEAGFQAGFFSVDFGAGIACLCLAKKYQKDLKGEMLKKS